MVEAERQHELQQVVITLLFLFMIFVIADVFTTQWLILNSPSGIQDELNPIGITLYRSFGSAGMIFPKIGLFIVFASMTVYFMLKLPHVRWFIEVSEALVLIQIAISLTVTFNNFIAILAVNFMAGSWPLLGLDQTTAVTSIYIADLALGAILANGVMYMWGLKRRALHAKVFLGLVFFITPTLVFSEGFRIYLWLFAIYVASASTALGLAFYITEGSRIRPVSS
jgi:hypothetical protein